MQEVSFLLEIIRSTLPFLNFLCLLVLLLFHSNLIVSNALYRFFEIVYLLVFLRIVTVLVIELCDQLSKFELFTLNEHVVGLQIFIFLLGQHEVQLVIELSYLIINLLLSIYDFIPLLTLTFRIRRTS